MGKINNQVIEIRNWLNSDRNYNDGVFLYNKYGNNDSLKRIFPGREKFQAQKLAYELAKLAGFSFSDFLKDQVIQEEVTPVSPQKNTTENNEDTGLTGQTNRKMIEYPPLIRRVIHEMSRLYNDRSMPGREHSEKRRKTKESRGYDRGPFRAHPATFRGEKSLPRKRHHPGRERSISPGGIETIHRGVANEIEKSPELYLER